MMLLAHLNLWMPAAAQPEEELENEEEADPSDDGEAEDGEAEDMLKQMDQDGDQKLTLEEIMAGIKKLADDEGEAHDEMEEHEEVLKRIFPKSDADGDGKLDLEEIKVLEKHFDAEESKEL